MAVGVRSVTVDRQALLDVAVRQAEAGRRVLWLARNRQSRLDAHRRLVESLPAGAEAHRAHGRERVTFATGGEVLFIPGGDGGRGHVGDTLIFDDVPVHPGALLCIAGSADGRPAYTTGQS